MLKNIKFLNSLAVDFLASIYRLSCNEKLLQKQYEINENFKFDESISEWLTKAKSKLTYEIQSEINTFFNYETHFGLCLINFIIEHRIESPEDFIVFIENTSPAELLLLFIDTGYGPYKEQVNNDLINKLLSDGKEAANFINNNIAIPPQQKWTLFEFFLNPEKMKNSLISLFKWYYTNIFASQIDNNKKLLNDIASNFKRKLELYGNEYIDLITNANYRNGESNYEIIICLSYYYEFDIFSSFIEDNNQYVYLIGFRYPELHIEEQHSILSNVQMFKTLGDETRLNIIRLLAQKPWYGKELAKMLHLSNSTVSYHLSLLSYNGLVKVEKIDKKVYFSLDIDDMKKAINDKIDKIFK